MTELRLLSTSLEGRQELSSLLDAYSAELSYSDPSEIMVAAAGQYASGLERLRIFFSAAAALCAVTGIFAVYSAAVKNRRLHWNRLRGRGMSRRKTQNVCLWESAVLSVPSAVVGIGAAWLLTGPVCRWMGWPQLAAHCVPALWLMMALALLTVLAAVLAAVIAAISVTGVWPGDVLYKGKE
jgi:predicted lysophospholipase L1 biosynthesis ABC-type transport system permease subunit